jgi:hypothetical protein
MVGFHAAHHSAAGIVVATVVGAGLRLLAVSRDWHLPSGSSMSWRERLENRQARLTDDASDGFMH